MEERFSSDSFLRDRSVESFVSDCQTTTAEIKWRDGDRETANTFFCEGVRNIPSSYAQFPIPWVMAHTHNQCTTYLAFIKTVGTCFPIMCPTSTVQYLCQTNG